MIRKAVYFDLNDKLHKELIVYKIIELDRKNHKYRLMHLLMKNIQNGRKSVLQVEKIQFVPDVNQNYFTIRYLERQ